MMWKSSFDTHNLSADTCRLTGSPAPEGFDRWRHVFTGYSLETGRPRRFFVEFFLCNPASGSQKPVFAASSSGGSPSYLLIKAGSWGENGAQLHKFYGWRKIEIDYGMPFSISAGECFISEDGIRGVIDVNAEEAGSRKEIMSDSGFMSWSLTVDKLLSFGDGEGWHAEGMRSSYTGEVNWNGVSYSVRPKDCNGFSDKNWGRSFPDGWLVLSSNRMKRPGNGRFLKNSAFAVGGRPDHVAGGINMILNKVDVLNGAENRLRVLLTFLQQFLDQDHRYAGKGNGTLNLGQVRSNHNHLIALHKGDVRSDAGVVYRWLAVSAKFKGAVAEHDQL